MDHWCCGRPEATRGLQTALQTNWLIRKLAWKQFRDEWRDHSTGLRTLPTDRKSNISPFASEKNCADFTFVRIFIYYHQEMRLVMRLVVSVCPSVCPVRALIISK